MGSRQYGQDVQVRIMQGGELVNLWNANSADWGMDDQKSRIKRLGTGKKPSDQRLDGHSGTITFDNDRPDLEDLVDELISAHQNNEHLKIDILRTDYYPKTGETRSWVYPNAVFSVDTDAGGQDDPVSNTLNWQSDLRKPLAA